MAPATARRRRWSGRSRAASWRRRPGTWLRPRSRARTAGPRTPSGSGAAGAQEGEEGRQGARNGVTPCPRPPRGGREWIGAGRRHTAGASVPAKRFCRNRPVAEFQAPAATGGNGAVTCTAACLPAGLVFDADGTGSCPGAEPNEVCGTPTTLTSGAQTVAVAVTAQDTRTRTRTGLRTTTGTPDVPGLGAGAARPCRPVRRRRIGWGRSHDKARAGARWGKLPRCPDRQAGGEAMKQQVLERARSTVEAFLHNQCADTTLSRLSVNPEGGRLRRRAPLDTPHL